jgi:hypothetical protein
MELVMGDERIAYYLSADEVRELMSTDAYTGTAGKRARELATEIRGMIA